MFPSNQPVEVKIYENGDVEYLTPLQDLEVSAYASDTQLGKNADLAEYRDWYLGKLRQQALDKAKYARIGFAPLTQRASDTALIDGDELKDLQRQFGDTIQSRHDSGFYGMYPHVESMDSALYRRLDNPMSGFSCINSQTNYYAPRFADMNNIHFENTHYGFIPISLDSIMGGDIVQLVRPWRAGSEAQRPFHAVMFDSYDDKGDVKVWDQHGSIVDVVPELTTYQHRSQDIPGEHWYRAKSAYRFVGDQQTEEDVIQAYRAYRERNKAKDQLDSRP